MLPALGITAMIRGADSGIGHQRALMFQWPLEIGNAHDGAGDFRAGVDRMRRIRIAGHATHSALESRAGVVQRAGDEC